MFKFERLEVYQLALEYLDLVYEFASKLPRVEEYNLKPHMIQAGTSIVLNVAEGSTGQTDPEQGRFLRIAIRSLIETVACRQIAARRRYLVGHEALFDRLTSSAETLSKKLQAFRRALGKDQ